MCVYVCSMAPPRDSMLMPCVCVRVRVCVCGVGGGVKDAQPSQLGTPLLTVPHSLDDVGDEAHDRALVDDGPADALRDLDRLALRKVSLGGALRHGLDTPHAAVLLHAHAVLHAARVGGDKDGAGGALRSTHARTWKK